MTLRTCANRDAFKIHATAATWAYGVTYLGIEPITTIDTHVAAIAARARSGGFPWQIEDVHALRGFLQGMVQLAHDSFRPHLVKVTAERVGDTQHLIVHVDVADERHGIIILDFHGLRTDSISLLLDAAHREAARLRHTLNTQWTHHDHQIRDHKGKVVLEVDLRWIVGVRLHAPATQLPTAHDAKALAAADR
jgi:hypothetical protein